MIWDMIYNNDEKIHLIRLHRMSLEQIGHIDLQGTVRHQAQA